MGQNGSNSTNHGQYAGQNAGNLNGYNAVQNVGNQVAHNPRVQNFGNQNGLMGVQWNGNLMAVRAEGNAAGYNGNQIRPKSWNAHSFCTNQMVSNRKGDTLAHSGSSMVFR
nr:hypothetical protein [Tanacetum cinerariifolium]